MEFSHTPTDVKRLTESLKSPLPEPVVKPFLIMVSGLPGTGKSYFSDKLVERLPFIVLESDALRKALFTNPIYSHPENARLFRAIHQLVEELLARRISIIFDATNLSETYRERVFHIAESKGAKLIVVRLEAPPELVRQRLEARKGTGSHSDADWAVYVKMEPSVEKITRGHYVVDTSKDIIPVLEKIVTEVQNSS